MDTRRDAIERLDGGRIPYYVTGSEALALHGLAFRQTNDIDIVVGIDAEDYERRLRPAFEPAYLVNDLIGHPPRWLGSAIEQTTVGKVDFIIREPGAWADSAMTRRQRLTDPGLGPVWVSTLEDLLLAKLEWAEGDLDGLQGRDVRMIVGRARLDSAYLRRHAAALGLTAVLDEVLDRA